MYWRGCVRQCMQDVYPTLSCSVLQHFSIVPRTYDPRWKCDVNSQEKESPHSILKYLHKRKPNSQGGWDIEYGTNASKSESRGIPEVPILLMVESGNSDMGTFSGRNSCTEFAGYGIPDLWNQSPECRKWIFSHDVRELVDVHDNAECKSANCEQQHYLYWLLFSIPSCVCILLQVGSWNRYLSVLLQRYMYPRIRAFSHDKWGTYLNKHHVHQRPHVLCCYSRYQKNTEAPFFLAFIWRSRRTFISE